MVSPVTLFILIMMVFSILLIFIISLLRRNTFKSFDEAFEQFEKDIQLHPNDPTILRDWGFTLILANRFSEAIEKLKLADLYNSSDSTTLWTLALALSELNKDDEALDKLNEACQIHPESFTLFVNTYFALAEKSSLIGNLAPKKTPTEIHTDAIRRLHRMLEYTEQLNSIRPRDSTVLQNWGSLLLLTAQFELAKEMFEQSLKLQPENIDIILKYAITLALLGKEEAAIAHFQQAKLLNADSSSLSRVFNSTVKLLNFFDQHGYAVELFQIRERLFQS